MRYLLNTEIGTFSVWDEHALDAIQDKASYIANLGYERDMVRTMKDNSVVFWGTGGDGRRPVEVRINPSESLSQAEREYIEIESREYKLEVKSGKILIGSPEWAGSVQADGLADERDGIKSIEIENGTYAVKVFFLAWDYKDESLNEMPEYVVVINKADASTNFSPITELEALG